MNDLRLNAKIVIPGGAGLVGQNLVARLKKIGYKKIVVLDKHRKNLSILKELHPDIQAQYADLSKAGEWENSFDNTEIVVMLQAQIGGLFYEDFHNNNIVSTSLIMSLIKSKNVKRLIHVSSSVVESSSKDFYTSSKSEQEKIVMESGIRCQILRPTLMFGWFDRKHLGWLARLMKRIPIFPIPGNGKFLRQPLYVGDFCNIIISCIENEIPVGVFNISGLQKIYYIDIIKSIKAVTGAKALIMNIPYVLFYALLSLWAIFDRNPPFTTQQLRALVAKDEFEVIDWPKIFEISATPFESAVDETFNHPVYSSVVLEF